MTDNALSTWANAYAWRGLPVIPLQPQGKAPVMKRWTDLKPTAADVGSWWASQPTNNIGLMCGTRSGLVDVETDIHGDLDGEDSLSAWAKETGCDLGKPWRFRSGGGGIHRLYRCGMPVKNRTGVLPAVDVRGDGGQCVLPPSLHPNGNRYSWLPGEGPDDAPDGPDTIPLELFALIQGDGTKGPLEVPSEIDDGSRNNTLFKFGCKLRQGGATAEEILAALQTYNTSRCNPPMDDEEVERIARSASRYERGDKAHVPEKIEAVSASALMGKQFRQLVQPVHNFISEGLTLLVSAPKIGKSWMVLLMGACIADGVPFWGRPTTKGRVLYLALEDSERRLQSRLRTLDLDHIPDNLFLQTSAPRIGDGFEEFLETWLSEDNAPAVVIVDTLQKIRGVEAGGKNVYAVDYDVIGKLKAIADKHQAAIICVHHTNKSRNVSDPFDKISGSTAVMGASDTTILITRDRGQDTATVSLTGRDVYGPDFTVRFDSGLWTLVSNNAEEYAATQRYEADHLVQTIRRLMEENPRGGRWTYKQLQEAGTSFGLVPFESGKDCNKKLGKGGLSSELLARDGLTIQWALELPGGRGVEIRPKAGGV